MLRFIARCINPVTGEWVAGYERPCGGFMALVTGLWSQEDAQREAGRLVEEAERRQLTATEEHHLRAPSAAWYDPREPM